MDEVLRCTSKGNHEMCFGAPDVIFKTIPIDDPRRKDDIHIIKIHLTKNKTETVPVKCIEADDEITCIKVAQFNNNYLLIALASGRILIFNTDTSDDEVLLDIQEDELKKSRVEGLIFVNGMFGCLFMTCKDGSIYLKKVQLKTLDETDTAALEEHDK
jgi:hypothetical protein